MSMTTADGRTIEIGDRAFDFHDWKWGVVGEVMDGKVELTHDDGTHTVVDSQHLLTHDPSRNTW